MVFLVLSMPGKILQKKKEQQHQKVNLNWKIIQNNS